MNRYTASSGKGISRLTTSFLTKSTKWTSTIGIFTMDWGDLIKSKVKLHLADEMVALQGIQKIRRANERLVQKTQDGTLGQKTSGDLPMNIDDDMQLGDTINTTTNNTSRGMNTVGALALAAAAALAGWAMRPATNGVLPDSGKEYGQDFYIGTPESIDNERQNKR